MDAATVVGVLLWTSVLLVAGICAFVRAAVNEHRLPANKVIAWETSWQDFGFCLWLFFTFYFLSTVGGSFIGELLPDEFSMLPIMLMVPCAVILCVLIGNHYARVKFFGTLNSEKHSPPKLAWLGFENFLVSIVPLFCVQMGMLALLAAWKYFGVDTNFPQQNVVELLMKMEHPLALGLFAFSVVVLAPLSEELFFRGVLYRFLKGKFGATAALVVSGVLFGLIHFNFLGFLGLTTIGLMLAWSYERSGNIAVPMFLHASFNANSVAVMLLFGPTPL